MMVVIEFLAIVLLLALIACIAEPLVTRLGRAFEALPVDRFARAGQSTSGQSKTPASLETLQQPVTVSWMERGGDVAPEHSQTSDTSVPVTGSTSDTEWLFVSMLSRTFAAPDLVVAHFAHDVRDWTPLERIEFGKELLEIRELDQSVSKTDLVAHFAHDVREWKTPAERIEVGKELVETRELDQSRSKTD